MSDIDYEDYDADIFGTGLSEEEWLRRLLKRLIKLEETSGWGLDCITRPVLNRILAIHHIPTGEV